MPGSRCPPKNHGSSSDPLGPRPSGNGIDVCVERIHVPQAGTHVPIQQGMQRTERGDWNAKVGSQETPRVTGKFGLGVRNEAGQRLFNRVLPRECTGHSKHPLPTTQEKTLHMDITKWSTLKSD
ncbi:hypothetical protein JEQ12_019506 [Ovis aries]|uniref:Uncharacterized protein n=1 Tax=Ovis aries TaxID=9940 RepID=A0A836A0U8_SHEEP|nr:hypothetical protein JEQ12_019506 [Ovis aries]